MPWNAQHIAPAPAAPAGIVSELQTVGDQAQETWRVAFHDEQVMRIARAERPLANVVIKPFVRHGGKIGARAVAVIDVARDARPCSRPVFAAIGGWTG